MSTSTIVRDCANTSVLSPARIAVRAILLLCERAEARRPRSGLTTGGFHSSTCLSPVGAPESVIAVTSASSNASAWSFGLPIVAEHRMNCGFAP